MYHKQMKAFLLETKDGEKADIYSKDLSSMKLGERRVFKYSLCVKEQDNKPQSS
jgi:hypothetical protein